MIQDRIAKIMTQIADLHSELKLLQAVHDDYITGDVWVYGMRTDAVYEDFCRRHPDITVTQHRFTRLICEALNLNSCQSRMNGVRGSFYERA